MSTTLIGLFENLDKAHDAANDLMSHGTPKENVSLIAAKGEEQTTSHAAGEAESGAIVGGLAGLMLGMSELAVPGIDPAVVGGWLAATLLGVGVGAVAGGLIGALTDLGIPNEQADELAHHIHSGATLIAVRTCESTLP